MTSNPKTARVKPKLMALSMSMNQWEYLSDHIDDGPRPIVRDAGEESTRKSLMERDLIYASTNSYTRLTTYGKDVLVAVLNLWADKLTEHGWKIERVAYGKFLEGQGGSVDGDDDTRAKGGPL